MLPALIPALKPQLPTFPLLICSIGNPGAQYAHTLHSAGHMLLEETFKIATRGSSSMYTPFTPNRSWGGGAVSSAQPGGGLSWKGYKQPKGLLEGAEFTGQECCEELWTWWRSGSYMNASGKGVAEAVKRWSAAMRTAKYPPEMLARARVVVLHDELETQMGKVTVRSGKSSLKGHNGLKSVFASLGGREFVRIGVGIDRPVSRDPEDVSRHVLRRATSQELKKIEEAAPTVLEALRDIAEGK